MTEAEILELKAMVVELTSLSIKAAETIHQQADRLEVLEKRINSASYAIAFGGDDWGETRAKAWVYGCIVGWDSASIAELNSRFPSRDFSLCTGPTIKDT